MNFIKSLSSTFQEHSVWQNQQFWEGAFYQDVQKDIKALYAQQSSSASEVNVSVHASFHSSNFVFMYEKEKVPEYARNSECRAASDMFGYLVHKILYRIHNIGTDIIGVAITKKNMLGQFLSPLNKRITAEETTTETKEKTRKYSV